MTNTPESKPFDKIMQECIENALPGIIENVLNINVVNSEELPDKIQHTIEREPDLLKKITDDKGEEFILHIEFQSNNEYKMANRMLLYLSMLLMKYELPVKQYVIFIGEEESKMPNRLQTEMLDFRYHLISISTIDYRIFLRSKNPDEKIFALLGDFGKEKPATVVTKIVNEIIDSTQGNLDKQRRRNQIRMLINLRKFVTQVNITDMLKDITFKKENDIFYIDGQNKGFIAGQNKGFIAGQQEGAINKSHEVVRNLIIKMGLSDKQVADIGGVSIEFVKKVRRELKQKN
ncbi:MAG: hypothetical protein LBE82_13835 [Chitinophagaceae bacterium]|jgi:hypothetical protein|nr:hypothetical protein [Chitinophagaceae bacterium]